MRRLFSFWKMFISGKFHVAIKRKNKQMKITIIHPAVGKIPGKKYLRAWQMEPLPAATLASLLPKDVEVIFFDDRMEDINYDESTDLVAISIETYTAKRTYQIASEYHKKKIPVIIGGFHATLCPDEVANYATSVVVGAAEGVWQNIINDFKSSNLKKYYINDSCGFSSYIVPDRSIYQGKNYVKITLLEAGRGCKFKCEFCSIHKFFKGKHYFRDTEDIVNEIRLCKQTTKLFFFVDDNIISDHDKAKQLFKSLIPLKIKWVGQADITISKDEELLQLMVKSGCQGVLIGFESLNLGNLAQMNKKMISNLRDIENAIRIIHKFGLRIYATFIFGYDNDSKEDFNNVVRFCIKNKFFMVGYNNLTPFPGTELYTRLQQEKRLIYEKWWLEDDYTYGQIPFLSKLNNEFIEKECRRIRRKFYGLSSILYRLTNWVNINSPLMFSFYMYINILLRNDTMLRKRFPLGDLGFKMEDIDK